MPQFLSSGLIKKRKEGKFGGRGGGGAIANKKQE